MHMKKIVSKFELDAVSGNGFVRKIVVTCFGWYNLNNLEANQFELNSDNVNEHVMWYVSEFGNALFRLVMVSQLLS